jgi:hypothetical protein
MSDVPDADGDALLSELKAEILRDPPIAAALSFAGTERRGSPTR